MSTHYTHYDLTYFTINCLAVLAVVIPKLPSVRTTSNFLLLVFSCVIRHICPFVFRLFPEPVPGSDITCSLTRATEIEAQTKPTYVCVTNYISLMQSHRMRVALFTVPEEE
jgi:hypothetical protein